ADVRDGWRLDRLNLSEPRLRIAEIVEQARATAENDRNHRNDDLVEQACRKILLYDARATADRDVLFGRCGPGLLECRLDAVGDEVERRSSFHLERLARMAGQNEDCVVVWRIVPPVAPPRI